MEMYLHSSAWLCRRGLGLIVYLLWIPVNTSWTEMLGTQEMGISPAEAGERRSRTSEANTGPCSLPQFSTETLQKETDTFPSQVAFFKHPFSPGDHLLCITQLRLSSRLLMSQRFHTGCLDGAYSSGMWNWRCSCRDLCITHQIPANWFHLSIHTNSRIQGMWANKFSS